MVTQILNVLCLPAMFLSTSKAPSVTNLFSASKMVCLSGGVGNGKLVILSIFIDFICKITLSIGVVWISGKFHSGNSSLNRADENKLPDKNKQYTLQNV